MGGHGAGDGGRIVVLVGDADDRISCLPEKADLKSRSASSPKFRFQDRRMALEPGIGIGMGEGKRFCLSDLRLSELGPSAWTDDFHFIAEFVFLRCHHRERRETGAVDRQRHRTGVEAGDVQTAGAHGLDLRRVGCTGKKTTFLPGFPGQVGE